jgi:ketosteroid isomerase-like protein
MSQENVDFVKALYASWGRGVDDELWDRMSPDFVADFSRRLVESGVLRGRAEARAYLGRVLEAWDEGYSNDPEEVLDAGDRVVAIVRASGRGKGSGVRVESRVVHVWTFRDGAPIKLEYFGEDRAAALEAVGLSE